MLPVADAAARSRAPNTAAPDTTIPATTAATDLGAYRRSDPPRASSNPPSAPNVTAAYDTVNPETAAGRRSAAFPPTIVAPVNPTGSKVDVASHHEPP